MRFHRAFFIVCALLFAACGGNRPAGDSTPIDSGGGGTDLGGGGTDLGTGTDLGSSDIDMGSTDVDLGSTDVDLGSTDVDLGSTASGACTNSADMTQLSSIMIGTITGNCAMMSFGAEPATDNCIRSMSGLSNPCADCFDGEVRCSVMNCALRCISETPDCDACRATFCDAAFTTCSGLSP